jgi:GT2 family glycosyltransferase
MISLITVNYNNVKVTCELIDSLRLFDRHGFELIVVDNASTEDASIIPARYPWVKFIRSNKNTGFAGGNNLGIKHAVGDYLFFVNNDTEFDTNILFRLKNILESDRSIGIVCPVLMDYGKLNQVQYAGFTKINKFTGRNNCITEVTGNDLIITHFAHGAAMMIPRHIVDQIGDMPENYFVYYEEMDWSAQVTKAGYQIVVDPSSVLYHKESQTIGRVNEMKSYFMARNRLLFMRRNSDALSLSVFWIFYLFIVTPKELAKYAMCLQWKNMIAHLSGIVWNFRYGTASKVLGYKFNF